jgi:hypothetical protein
LLSARTPADIAHPAITNAARNVAPRPSRRRQERRARRLRMVRRERDTAADDDFIDRRGVT